VQWLRDAAVALARVGGGDIDVLVIDPASMGAGSDGLGDLFERLHAACARTQTIVASDSGGWTSDCGEPSRPGPPIPSRPLRAPQPAADANPK
jgi:hypothetical protein